MSARRPLTILLFAAGLAACGRGAPAAEIEREPDAPIPAPPTAAAIAREVPDVLRLNGTLLADEESRLSPLVPGRVLEVLVERGARVEEGQPLVRIRDTDYRLQQAAARAQLEQAQARLGVGEDGNAPAVDDTAEVRSALAQMTLADEQYRRAQELAQRGVYAPAQLDEAAARAETAREQHRLALQNARSAAAQLASARVQLRQASSAVSDSVVRAPFAGEIAERNVSVGEYVGPSAQLVTLVRTDPLRVELEVPEERVLDVRPGQAVQIRLAALPDRVFDGTVRYVSASVGRQTRAMTVEAVVPNTEGVLRPGMFAEARIDLARTRALVAIPETAVLTHAGVHRAFVVAGGAVEERLITIAERDAETVLVDTGLAAGDLVATGSLDELFDGARLTN